MAPRPQGVNGRLAAFGKPFDQADDATSIIEHAMKVKDVCRMVKRRLRDAGLSGR